MRVFFGLPRDESKAVQCVNVPAHFNFHFANGYEEEDQIIFGTRFNVFHGIFFPSITRVVVLFGFCILTDVPNLRVRQKAIVLHEKKVEVGKNGQTEAEFGLLIFIENDLFKDNSVIILD